MNHVKNMLLKQPGQGNVVTQFLPNELKFNAMPTQKDDLSEMPGFLSCGLTVLICGEVSMLSAWIRKMFDLWVFSDNFDLEGYPRNCLKSLFRKDIFENTWNWCYVFHRQQSFLINEWRKVWNSCHASWTWAAVMLLQSLYFYSFLPNHPPSPK